MKNSSRVMPFPLRLAEDVRGKAESEAQRNRRSLNAEIALLVEEGLKWREAKKGQAAA
ncbi:MAG: Arc family DNA-binding protein [Pseudomonadota bacterium]